MKTEKDRIKGLLLANSALTKENALMEDILRHVMSYAKDERSTYHWTGKPPKGKFNVIHSRARATVPHQCLDRIRAVLGQQGVIGYKITVIIPKKKK